jgi:hypothetical protein
MKRVTIDAEQLQIYGLSGRALTMPKGRGFGTQIDPDDPGFGWMDLFGVLRPDPLGANSPTLAAMRDGNCREYFYAAADKMDKDYHINHDDAGHDLFIHIHWGHIGTAISGNFVVTFSYTYAKGHGQEIYPVEKQLVLTYPTMDITTTPQYIHRIDELQLSLAGGSETQIDTNLIEPDGVIIMNMTVTEIPTITGGAQAKPFIHFADIHYRSTGQATKQKAPNFYV